MTAKQCPANLSAHTWRLTRAYLLKASTVTWGNTLARFTSPRCTLLHETRHRSASEREEPKIADASVLEVWKGPKVSKIRFVASPTWTCDASDAIQGEKALLFLFGKPGEPYTIAANGRGRLPLIIVEGARFLTIWKDFMLPQETPKVTGPDSKFAFIQSVELARVREIVNAARLESLEPAEKGIDSPDILD